MLARIEGSNLVAENVITDIERTTLIDLRDRLRRGEIVGYDRGPPNDPYRLGMANWAHCICGLCYKISNGAAFTRFREPLLGGHCDDRLARLFLPRNMAERTPTEAEHAITTFLTTGNAEWSANP